MNKLLNYFIKTVSILTVIFVLLFNFSNTYCANTSNTNTNSTKNTSSNSTQEQAQKAFEKATNATKSSISTITNNNDSDTNFKKQVKKEGGSLFEKIIGECIGGIAQAIFDFVSDDSANVGFKDYDELIFNKNVENESYSPFSEELWNKTMDWYRVFAIISGSLITIAVIILAFKILYAGVNTAKRNDAKDSMMRLILRWFSNSISSIIYKTIIIFK